MTSDTPPEPASRRPLASRGLSWIRALASALAARGVAPNAISVASVVFSLGAAAAIIGTDHAAAGAGRLLWVAAAVLVQLRLLANVIDGLVAIEGGRASPVGDLYNEVPDRISDALVLVALGLVRDSSPHLGYSAALLAVFVAYVRAMGAVAGAGQCFRGPLAKPQRMFLVTLACVFYGIAPLAWRGPWTAARLGVAGWLLVVIALGCLWTVGARLSAIGGALRRRP